MKIRFSKTEAEATLIPESHAEIEELLALFGGDKHIVIGAKPQYSLDNELDEVLRSVW